ncbi:MAG: hypothetical protein ABIM30_00575 [candidate division WOR-3 bacterium]
MQTIREEILDILKLKPSTAKTMAALIGVDVGEIYWGIHNLRREGYKIVNMDGKYKIATNMNEVRSEINKLKKNAGGYFITAKAMQNNGWPKYKQLDLFDGNCYSTK